MNEEIMNKYADEEERIKQATALTLFKELAGKKITMKDAGYRSAIDEDAVPFDDILSIFALYGISESDLEERK